jgi:DNA-binding transcriptional MerR regulator
MSQLDLFAAIQEEIQEQESKIPVLQDDKLYHSITIVAKALSINASMLRFWEKEFPQLKPRKNGKGDRLYKQEDIKLINTILYLTKVKKFTLEGCRNYLKNDAKAGGKETELVEQLNELKLFLTAIKKSL